MQITIEIENDRELLSLWHRLNMAESEVIASLRDCSYTYNYLGTEHQGCYQAWDIVNQLVQTKGLQNQL